MPNLQNGRFEGSTHIGSFNTSNLLKHLKTRHPDEHNKIAAAKANNKAQQQTLEAWFQARAKLLKDSPRATGSNVKIAEFIVLDDKPLSVVENIGFRRLMEYVEPRYCLPVVLVVHEGLLSQSVSDALANTQKIVGHFKHSPLATSRLEDIQGELHVPTKRLQQDVTTRWNSTYYMLESVLEQRRSISAYGAEYELPASLTPNQWSLLGPV
ncbi:hypothetical protein WMY93_010168 [Mugilogobius chulae]|uniref:Transposase n=1 Tax=Mugilogobius chulae TaxID=88201 RepID=A0AAW0PA92_9GOBI